MKQTRSAAPIAVTVVTVLLLLPLLYALSYGPAWRMFCRGSLSADAFYDLYYPLDRTGSACPPFANALGWYSNLWTPEAKTEIDS